MRGVCANPNFKQPKDLSLYCRLLLLFDQHQGGVATSSFSVEMTPPKTTKSPFSSPSSSSHADWGLLLVGVVVGVVLTGGSLAVRRRWYGSNHQYPTKKGSDEEVKHLQGQHVYNPGCQHMYPMKELLEHLLQTNSHCPQCGVPVKTLVVIGEVVEILDEEDEGGESSSSTTAHASTSIPQSQPKIAIVKNED
jgi:hypothetical protein